MSETSADVVKRYLQDAVAAKRAIEIEFESFAESGANQTVSSLFRRHVLETKDQLAKLTARLEALGGSPSGAKAVLAQIFESSAKRVHSGARMGDQTTRDLLMTFALDHNQIASHEALAMIAEAAGDDETASLAQSIQDQERLLAEEVWRTLPAASQA